MRVRLRVALACGAVWLSVGSIGAAEQPGDVERGRYLATIMDCAGCHAPVKGGPLTGSDKGFNVAGEGVFWPPNLTPDPKTGLGGWNQAEIVTVLRTGVRPDGRILVPVMPWRAFAHLTTQDAEAIAAYLQSLAPVVNAAPAPTTVADARHPYRTLVTPPLKLGQKP